MTVSTSAEDRDRSDNSGPDRYGLVLTLLVVSFLLAAFLPGERARTLPLALYVTALTQALRSAQLLRLGFRGLMATLLVVSAVAGILLIFVPNRIVHRMVSLWVAAVLALAIVAVVRRVLVHRVVNLQTIFGALRAYLLIGFLYAALFAAVASLIIMALIRALAIAGAVAIAFGLDLSHALWLPIATVIAMKPSLKQTTLVAVQRLVGALIGALAAALLPLLPANEHGLRLFEISRALEVVAIVLFMHGVAVGPR